MEICKGDRLCAGCSNLLTCHANSMSARLMRHTRAEIVINDVIYECLAILRDSGFQRLRPCPMYSLLSCDPSFESVIISK